MKHQIQIDMCKLIKKKRSYKDLEPGMIFSVTNPKADGNKRYVTLIRVKNTHVYDNEVKTVFIQEIGSRFRDQKYITGFMHEAITMEIKNPEEYFEGLIINIIQR